MLNAIFSGLIILGPIFVSSMFLSIKEQRKREAERLRLEEERKQKELESRRAMKESLTEEKQKKREMPERIVMARDGGRDR